MPGVNLRAVIVAVPERKPQGNRLTIADVAVFYGEHTGGIRTYLHEKARFAAETGAFEHHMIVPGRGRSEDGRHEVPSVQLIAAGGWRLPWGVGAVKTVLRRIRPDVVVLHDPFWRPAEVVPVARAVGARVVAAHHASAALNAAGIPGPDGLYLPVLRRIYRKAYEHVDAVMSVVDSRPCSGREAELPLRFGLHPAFRPGPAVRGDRVLYVGRLAWEKGIFTLLEAAALSDEQWPLKIVGDGPAAKQVGNRVKRLGLSDRVEFGEFVDSRSELARLYRSASCVVQPGPHETFGLVAFEAAASGAHVVTCDTTPAADVVAPLAQTFAPEDPDDLLAAIGRARATEPDFASAVALSENYTWERVFSAELEAMTRLSEEGTAYPAAG